MNCREFLALLEAEGAALTPEAHSHVESCPACARADEHWRTARRELRALGEEQSPAFLTERVMARVRAERRDAPHPVRLPWRLRPAMAAASAVVVALAGYVLWNALRTAGTPLQEARSATVLADKRDRATTAPAPPPALAAAPETAPAAGPTVVPAPQPRLAHGEKGTRSAVQAPSPSRKAGAPRSAQRDEAVETRAAAVAPPVEPGAVGGVAYPAGVAEEADVAADQVSKEGARAAGAEPALAKLEAASFSGPALVELELIGQQDGSLSVLRAPAVAAPPRGQRWIVLVARDGTVTLLDAGGHDIGAAQADTIAAVRAAGPAPGRYSLTRR